MEKPVKNCDPHRGINTNIVFHFFFALGAAPGRFRGPAGVGKFHVFLKNGVRRAFLFFLFFSRCVACPLKWPLEAPGRPQGGPRDAPGRPWGPLLIRFSVDCWTFVGRWFSTFFGELFVIRATIELLIEKN